MKNLQKCLIALDFINNYDIIILDMKRLDQSQTAKIVYVPEEDWKEFKLWLVLNDLTFTAFVRQKIKDVLTIIKKKRNTVST